MIPTAHYIGMQERIDGPPIALYNVTGGRWDKSTLSERTCIERGIKIIKKDENGNISKIERTG